VQQIKATCQNVQTSGAKHWQFSNLSNQKFDANFGWGRPSQTPAGFQVWPKTSSLPYALFVERRRFSIETGAPTGPAAPRRRTEGRAQKFARILWLPILFLFLSKKKKNQVKRLKAVSSSVSRQTVECVTLTNCNFISVY
jgi:hypothetical protein